MNWLQSLLFGILSGFTEFLPVSAEAHRFLFLKMAGAGETEAAMSLAVRAGALLALLLACGPQISKINRERRISAIPPGKRKRQPDASTLLDVRFLKTAGIWVIIPFAVYPFISGAGESLWILAVIMLLCGVLLYIPQFFSTGNKESQSVSRLDGILVGLGCGLSVIPGMSAVAGASAVGNLRGCDRQYILNMSLILCIVSVIGFMIFDAIGIAALGTAAVNGKLVLNCVLAAAAAFPGAWLGIQFMRFLAVKAGFSGFAYYNWGAALFMFILYLTI